MQRPPPAPVVSAPANANPNQRYLDAAKTMENNKHSEKSKNLYRTKVRLMISIWKQNFPNLIEVVDINSENGKLLNSTNSIKFPIQNEHEFEQAVLYFFGMHSDKASSALSTAKNNNKNQQNNASSINNGDDNNNNTTTTNNNTTTTTTNNNNNNNNFTNNHPSNAILGSGVVRKDTLQGYKSALLWYLNCNKYQLPEELNRSINNLIIGYKKTCAELQVVGALSLQVGVKEFTIDAFKLIAWKLLCMDPYQLGCGQGKWDQVLFSPCFLLLNWNQGSRPTNTADTLLNHLGRDGDGITIALCRHKGDQTGENSKPVILHHNRFRPEICVFLALAITTFTIHASSTGEPPYKLLPGSEQDNRFSKILRSVLNHLNSVEKQVLGSLVEDLSVYSIRKGVQTHIAGILSGPSVVQQRLRAGHSIGQVQDRYIFESKVSYINDLNLSLFFRFFFFFFF